MLAERCPEPLRPGPRLYWTDPRGGASPRGVCMLARRGKPLRRVQARSERQALAEGACPLGGASPRRGCMPALRDMPSWRVHARSGGASPRGGCMLARRGKPSRRVHACSEGHVLAEGACPLGGASARGTASQPSPLGRTPSVTMGTHGGLITGKVVSSACLSTHAAGAHIICDNGDPRGAD